MQPVQISALSPHAAERAAPQLVTLLQDAVNDGASIGFLPPMSRHDAEDYWRSAIAAVADGSRVLLVASRGDEIVGAAQLDLCLRANGLHRAEVSKVMVHTGARRRGIGRALMLMLESEARHHGRTTLVLDTRKGDPSEALYASLGWAKAGEIPNYARSANGELHATAFYYKLLGS